MMKIDEIVESDLFMVNESKSTRTKEILCRKLR